MRDKRNPSEPAEASELADKHFLVTLHEKLDGTSKYVTFRGGVGVFDAKAIGDHRPEWVVQQPDGSRQVRAGVLENFLHYWEKRADEVEEISAEDAEAFRDDVASDEAYQLRVRGLVPTPKRAPVDIHKELEKAAGADAEHLKEIGDNQQGADAEPEESTEDDAPPKPHEAKTKSKAKK